MGARGAGRAGSPCEPETTCRRTALSGSSRLQFPGNVDKAGEYCGELANRAYGKTVWSWPSSLRSSFSRRCQRAQPGGRHRQFAGRGRPEGIRLPGERGISRQTTAQGRPSVWRHLYAAVRFFCATHSRSGPRVRGRHPVFPAPSWFRRANDQAELGRNPPRERYRALALPRRDEARAPQESSRRPISDLSSCLIDIKPCRDSDDIKTCGVACAISRAAIDAS